LHASYSLLGQAGPTVAVKSLWRKGNCAAGVPCARVSAPLTYATLWAALPQMNIKPRGEKSQPRSAALRPAVVDQLMASKSITPQKCRMGHALVQQWPAGEAQAPHISCPPCCSMRSKKALTRSTATPKWLPLSAGSSGEKMRPRSVGMYATAAMGSGHTLHWFSSISSLHAQAGSAEQAVCYCQDAGGAERRRCTQAICQALDNVAPAWC
jgi:hypothetical protein